MKVGPTPYDSSPYNKWKFGHGDRCAQREDGVETQGEVCVKLEDWSDAPRHGRIFGRPPDTGKRQGRSLLQVLEGEWPCQHPEFKLWAFRTVREEILVVLKHLIVVLCYSSPRKLLQLPWQCSLQQCCRTLPF